jgi:RNA polymerase II subunit A small phosphatase-like protein
MNAADDRLLLILDVDETLVHASETALDRGADFRAGPYHVYKRPHLEAFLNACGENFTVAIWSSSGADYLAAVLREILPRDITPAFVWGRERCVRQFDFEQLETIFLKDLKKVARLGFNLDRVLIVDDSREKVRRNYGNAIYVSAFDGDPTDNELHHLSAYLPSLHSVPNV